MRVDIKRAMVRGVERDAFCWRRKGMRVDIKRTMVRGVERGGVLLVKEKDEGGYKADYGERVRQRCFC